MAIQSTGMSGHCVSLVRTGDGNAKVTRAIGLAMTRKPRKQSPANIYHVTNRGVSRQIIFEDDADRERFLVTLRRFMAEFDGELYAWCLMSNHFHLLFHMDLEDISLLMKKVGVSYAAYFNRKYDRVGTLFQDRFKSEPIDTDSYLMTVVRYIHQNPVKAGISRTCEYRWSSYREYAHNNRKLCSTAFVISVFGGTSWLILYHNEIADADKCMAPEVRWRMSDGEVARLVRRAFRRFGLPDASGAVKAKRDAVIRKLLADGVPVNQLARVLGVGRAVVRYA